MDEKEVPTHYASGVQITISPWDVTLFLSLREGTQPKDVRPVANVIMSPQHAWVMARLLRRQMDLYEQQFGKIALPPRLLNDLGLEELP